MAVIKGYVKAGNNAIGIQRRDKEYSGEYGSYEGTILAIQDSIEDLRQAERDLSYDLSEIQDCKLWLARLANFAKKASKSGNQKDADAFSNEMMDERNRWRHLITKYSNSALARVIDVSREKL